MAILTLPQESMPIADPRAGLPASIGPESRESQFAELAKANAALRRIVTKLADVSDVEAVMVEAIDTAAEVIDSSGGGLGLYLPEERGFRTIFEVIDGRRVHIKELSHRNRLYSIDEVPIRLAWEQFHCGDGILWCPPDSCYLTEDSRQVLFEQGFASSALVALKRGPDCIGYLGFFSRRSEDLSTGQRELLRATGDQISVMLELSRLAHLSESAAVAREREVAAQERAVELAKANEALRLGIERIADMRETKEIVEAFLIGAIRSVSASGGAILLHVPGTVSSFRAEAVYEGYLLTADQIAGHPYLGALADLTSRNPISLFASILSGEFVMVRTSDMEAEFPEAYRYHSQRGDRCVWQAPLKLQDRTFGYMGFAIATDDRPSAASLETIRALCHQLVLALEMTRLAEESEATALVQEREITERARAAELELANQALRRGIAGLGRLDDLSQFLGEMLRAAVTTSGAHTGGVVILDKDAQTYCVNPLLRAHGGFEPEGSVLTSPLPLTPMVKALLRDTNAASTAWLMTETDLRMDPEFVNFHRAEANRLVAHIPMRVGDQLVGLLGLGFPTLDTQFEKDFPLLRSLADQMCLAVQMVRLSDQAKSAAIAREREQATLERLAEVERVNALLLESSQALAQAQSPDQICELFLRQAVKALQGTAGGLQELVQGTEHRYLALVQDDRVVPKNTWEYLPIVVGSRDITRRDLKGVMARVVAGNDVWFPVDEEFAAWAPESAEYHRERGNAAIVMWPFYFGTVVKGNIGIAFSHTNPLTASQRETLKALTSQTSLALELGAMTAEVELAATTRERERSAQARAIELAQSNEQLALRDRLLTASAQALEQLISAENFASGVAEALRQIGEAAELSRVQLLMETTLKTGERAHKLIHEWWSNELESQGNLGHLFFPNADFQEVIDLLYQGERWWARTEDWPSGVQPVFRELGIIWTGVVPICVQQEYVGLVAFDQCKPGRDWSEAEIEALTIAAKGIGAALSQQRMAAQLVSEREQAAQDRASELVKANMALRGSVDDLVTQTTTEGILTCLMKQAVDISGASSGAILKRIAGSEFEYVTIYANGTIRTSEQILAAGTNTEMRLASRLDPTGYFSRLATGEAQTREVDDERIAKHLPRSTKYHNSVGSRRIYDFPYKVAGGVVGYIGLAFADKEPPSQTVQETIKALSTQVGLALEFRRISEQLEHTAVMEERNKFARDLHDTLAQGFAAILMQLGAAALANAVSPALQPYLTRIEDLARLNLADARRTVSELRTSERVRDPFLSRLSELARQVEGVCGNIVHIEVTGIRRTLPTVAEDELFLITQESLTNAMKHADAVELKVEIVFTESGLRVKVKDNGKGFSLEEQGQPGHFGLQTMQERAHRINAKLTIISEPGFGTEILTVWNDPTLG